MMTSPTSQPAELPAFLGHQHPRRSHIPAYPASSGDEAIELAAVAGLTLDPWQELALRVSLAEAGDGARQFFQFGLCAPRQNGKNEVLVARELAGLFLLGESLIIHSAHLFDTSLEAYRRLSGLIEGCPQLSRRVKKMSAAHGSEGIELHGGQRIRFRTRTKSGGRGFSAGLVIFDEAMVLSEAAHAALVPTLATRADAQIWYVGSAVDEAVHDDGRVFAAIRQRAQDGIDARMAWLEWSADPERAGLANGHTDVELWAQANPGLGRRISLEHVAAEQRALDARAFGTERLGVGHWPALDDDARRIIARAAWEACADPASEIASTPVYALDVSPLRNTASIATAGVRSDDLVHVEAECRDGSPSWVVARCAALKAANPSARFLLDPKSQASTLLTGLADAGVPVEEVTVDDVVAAAAGFLDAVNEQTLRYPAPQDALSSAVAGAATRGVGNRWAWTRGKSGVDITPLVAASLAAWAATTGTEPTGIGLMTMAQWQRERGPDRVAEIVARAQARRAAIEDRVKARIADNVRRGN